ncbi:MAG: response regulator [Candidatus Aureabacteria bacterium]|nr:response regulator [Candidatus Auribacterota bacterium]
MAKKILIIDDHGHIRFMLNNRLKKIGYETATAEDATNILNLTRAENPDLIIIDMMMPGIDGIEASKILSQNDYTKNIPIIMLTALSSKNVVLDALRSGIRDYIVKPFKADELYKKIKNLIGDPAPEQDKESKEVPSSE